MGASPRGDVERPADHQCEQEVEPRPVQAGNGGEHQRGDEHPHAHRPEQQRGGKCPDFQVLAGDLWEQRLERSRHHQGRGQQRDHEGADAGVPGHEREAFTQVFPHLPRGALPHPGNPQRDEREQPEQQESRLHGERQLDPFPRR